MSWRWWPALTLLLTRFTAGLAQNCSNVVCITFLHFNDVHDRTDPDDINHGACDFTSGPCFGGYARLSTIIRNATQEAKDQGCYPVLLHAGDELQGTFWDTIYYGMDAARWGSFIGVQAMTVGNHEFNYGTAGLLNFTKAVNFPILSANGNYSAAPELAAAIKPYTIINLPNNIKVGVVGVSPEITPTISSADPRFTFTPEVDAANKYNKELQAQGVKINVLLSHAGYPLDRVIAKTLEGSQLIIGAHSHSFLANPPFPVLMVNGDGDPVNDRVDGPYPTVEKGPKGDDVLIVQAGWGTRYLGVLNTEFCADNGRLLSYDGEPVLVNWTTPIYPDVNRVLEEYAVPIRRAFSDPIASTKVTMTHVRLGLVESNQGNSIADSLIWGLLARTNITQKYPDLPYVGLFNNGLIRVDVPAGNITFGQLQLVLPLDSTMGASIITGRMLKALLQRAQRDDIHGAGMQLANFRYGRDLNRERGDRLYQIEVKDPKSGKTMLVTDDMKLILASRASVLGWDMLAGSQPVEVDSYLWVTADRVVWRDYLNATSPVDPRIEGRIVDCDKPANAQDVVCNAATSTAG